LLAATRSLVRFRTRTLFFEFGLNYVIWNPGGGDYTTVKTWSDSFSVPSWRSHYSAQFYLHQEVGAFQKAECLPGHITKQNFTSAHAPSGHFYFSKCSHLIVFSLCQWGGV
jgi:hypothetical protein